MYVFYGKTVRPSSQARVADLIHEVGLLEWRGGGGGGGGLMFMV